MFCLDFFDHVWPILIPSVCSAVASPFKPSGVRTLFPWNQGNAPPCSPRHAVSIASWQHPDVHRLLIGVRQSILRLVGTGCSVTLLRILLRKKQNNRTSKLLRGGEVCWRGAFWNAKCLKLPPIIHDFGWEYNAYENQNVMFVLVCKRMLLLICHYLLPVMQQPKTLKHSKPSASTSWLTNSQSCQPAMPSAMIRINTTSMHNMWNSCTISMRSMTLLKAAALGCDAVNSCESRIRSTPYTYTSTSSK